MHRRPLTAALCVFFGAVVTGAQPQRSELIERTLAIVAGQVITLTDLRTAVALGLVEGVTANDLVASGTPRLVDRLLVLREVQRYTPPEPEDAAIDERLAEIRTRLGPAALTQALEAGGFTEARLRAWIRDDLRIAAYLRQRFAATGASAEVVDDWIAELRRRTPVVELWRTKD